MELVGKGEMQPLHIWKENVNYREIIAFKQIKYKLQIRQGSVEALSSQSLLLNRAYKTWTQKAKAKCRIQYGL